MNTPYHSYPGAHALQQRRLMSAIVEDGVLVITGTSADDRITVYESRDTSVPTYVVGIQTPSIPGSDQYFRIPGDGVRSVTVRALAGDDSVNVGVVSRRPDAFDLMLPTRLDGGTGNDEILGGRARSFIIGGFGNDTIYGGRQSDWIDGGWGDDVINGNAGNDIIFGRDGNDVLSGGAGDDRLYGGTGDDRLGMFPVGPAAGEPGNDFMSGGDGVDRIYGGTGTDRLLGGPGRDVWLNGWSAADKDTSAERLDRRPDEPTEMIPATR